jgi:hypothetical protein
MNWFTKLFKEDTTPATVEQKNLIVNLLSEAEEFYRGHTDLKEYQQYANALKEIREDSSFIQELTVPTFQKLCFLLHRPWYTNRYPGAEKLAFQQMLRKERLSKES